MKTITNLKRCFVLILACVLLVASAIVPSSADVISKKGELKKLDSFTKVPTGYELVTTSENLKLYVDYNTGYFKVVNTDNGYVWNSVPDNLEYDTITDGDNKSAAQSLLNISYLLAEEESSVTNLSQIYGFVSDEVENENIENLEVKNIKNGFRITYLFTLTITSKDSAGEDVYDNANIKVPLDITLTDGHLNATIDFKDTEIDSRVFVAEYNILPYFGAASWTDEGYIFVPDGSGALIDFQNHVNKEANYSQPVYGEDVSKKAELESEQIENIRMPVFGLKNGNNAFVAIITKGDEIAEINANPTNLNFGHSKVNANFVTRTQNSFMMFKGAYYEKQIHKFSQMSKNIKELSVSYYILSGKDADYIGMANEYRNYLIDNKLIEKNVSKPTLNVDAYGAVDVKANFLGFNYSKILPLTTYEDAVTMVKALKKNGIKDVSLRYMGWANKGITNKKMLTKPSLIGKLGGKSDYNEMISYFDKNNIEYRADADLLYFVNSSRKYAAKTVFSQFFYKYQYLRSVYVNDLNGVKQKILNPRFIEENANKYFSKYEKVSGTKNISLSTLTSIVYSSLDPEDAYPINDVVSAIDGALKDANKSGLNVAGEAANQYAFKYLSKIYKSPVNSSAYRYFDSEIPFYQIVLHGYVNMTGSPMVQSSDIDTMYLKCVESGIELLWNGIKEESAELSTTNYDYLYGSTYDLWVEDATDRYNAYQPLLEKIYKSQIINHEEVQTNVTVTTYDNGVKVYVNYTTNDVEIDGVQVKARNFAYKEG